MKENDLEKISFPLWEVKAKPYIKPKRLKTIKGFDTETFEGKVSLITSYPDKEHKIIYDIEDLLKFLYRQKHKFSHNFFFNLEYDCNAILKHLPRKNLDQIIDFGFTKYGDIKFYVIKRKLLAIQDEILKMSVNFVDISQFYMIGSLEKTVKKALNIDYVKRVSEEERERGFPPGEITGEHIKYCLEDSYFCYLLAKKFVDLSNSFQYVPKFLSPASLSKSLFKTMLKSDYRPYKKDIQQFALWSYGGGRFSTFFRGFLPRLFTYDINSAYPEELSKLPYPEGKEIRDKKYHKDSMYSYFKCDIKLFNEDLISPLRKFLKREVLVVYPRGVFKDIFITKKEYEFLRDYGEVEIKSAIHLFNEKPDYIFKPISDIYKKRMELKKKGDPLEYVIKLSLNAMYGLSIQLIKVPFLANNWTDEEEGDIENELVVYDGEVKLKKSEYRAGAFFNPIWATEITSRTRLKLFKDLYKFQDKLVMIATDSLTFTEKIPLKCSQEMGDYELENKDSLEGIIIGNGVYDFREKRRFRGFGKGIDLFELLENNKNETKIEFKKKKPVKLSQSNSTLNVYKDGVPYKTSRSDFNVFFEFPKTLNINSDHKRIWERDFKDCRDVLENQIHSRPLILR